MAAIAHGKAILTSPPNVKMPFLVNGVNTIWPEEPSSSSYADLIDGMLQDDVLIRSLENGASELGNFFKWEQIAFEHEAVINIK